MLDYNVEVIDNQKELENLVISYYETGGTPGNEPFEVREALDKLKSCGGKYRELVLKNGGWM